MDADCATTLRAHAARKRKAKPRVVQGRLEDIEPAELRKSLGLRRGEIALIAGGPPCQPFTTHGRRQGIKDGRAAGVFPRYLQFVREFMPHAAVMENVDGILSAALSHRPLADRTKSRPLRPDEMKGSFLRWLVREMARLGYSVSWGLDDLGQPLQRALARYASMHRAPQRVTPFGLGHRAAAGHLIANFLMGRQIARAHFLTLPRSCSFPPRFVKA